MARKSKGNKASGSISPSSDRDHVNFSLDKAENGFVARVSCEGKDGYHSKTFISPDRAGALRIATDHISATVKKEKGKGKSKGKRKISISKRS